MRRIRPLVVVLVLTLPWTLSISAAARHADKHLAIPPRGSASPRSLPDGSPIWVVHQDDGKVRVLSALSTHTPYGVSVLVGWCPATKGFEDPMYESSWKQDGSKSGGPAPSDLAHFKVLSRDAHDVTVGTREIRGPRRADVGSGAVPPPTELENIQRPCWDGRAVDYNPGSTLRHDAVGVPAANFQGLSRLAARYSAPRFRRVSGASLVVNRDASPTICERPARTKCATVDIAGVSRDPRLGVDRVERVVLEGDFLVRVGSGRISDVVFVHGYKMSEPAPPVATADSGLCYNDPPTGAPKCE